MYLLRWIGDVVAKKTFENACIEAYALLSSEQMQEAKQTGQYIHRAKMQSLQWMLCRCSMRLIVCSAECRCSKQSRQGDTYNSQKPQSPHSTAPDPRRPGAARASSAGISVLAAGQNLLQSKWQNQILPRSTPARRRRAPLVAPHDTLF
jgi:hypothetical protein